MLSSVDVARYARASALVGGRLALTTSAPESAAGPVFFRGSVRAPRVVAAGVLALADIAAADFRPARAVGGGRDPLVTGDGVGLRLESLSGCGGVYGRLDLPPTALDGTVEGRGTTNVDVNPPLYEALTRVGAADGLRLAVGAQELAVTTASGQVVEKKVPLPTRWLRGLAEVAARAAPLDLRAECPAVRAAPLLARLATGTRRQVRWLLPAGARWRVAGAPAAGAVCVADGHRLAVLRPLLPLARTVRLYAPPAGGGAQVSGWELDFGPARFTLLLSAASHRGFAGEGQLLGDLHAAGAVADGDALASLIAADPVLDRAAVAARTGWVGARVAAALAALASAGQVGYDNAQASWFHRPLPYRADLVAALHPRLSAARVLASAGRVRRTAAGIEVTSGAARYLVHRRGAGWACTCAWWAAHRGERGPCKHVLAATIDDTDGGAR